MPVPPTRRPSTNERARFAIMMGIVGLLLCILASYRMWTPTRQPTAGPPSTATAAPEPTAQPMASEGPAFASTAVSPQPSETASSPVDRAAEPECRRTPLRGCAPAKDERGCYHCARCWRPFHYDIEGARKSVSFSCPQMPNAPLYVELVDKASDDGVERWLVAASFDGQTTEQVVAPNLGGAFFSSFHGGTVELTATPQACKSSASFCQGDVRISINAVRDDARP